MGLVQVLREWLDHRKVVLCRRSEHRLKQIDHRLEVLEGFLIAYLNLDEVIRIIRSEDEPKPVLMERFKLSDVQAEAILNMRLRSLRKLEEMEINTEHSKLSEERQGLIQLLGSDEKQWTRSPARSGTSRSSSVKRRPSVNAGPRTKELPQIDVSIEEALIEKEPVTIVLSEKGWDSRVEGSRWRSRQGGVQDGRQPQIREEGANGTDKLVLFATNGKFYTLGVNELPGGRGQGEPAPS